MTSNQRCGNRQLLFTSIFYISTLASILPSALSFSTFLAPPKTFVPTTRKARSRPLFAGGFEWEDPTEEFDQGVENPFKNEAKEDDMQTDPARLLAPRLSGVNLYFVGMMGCGKTTVGDAVARRMGSYSFLDTDSIIESVTKKTIPELFADEGEETFREIETQVLDQVHAFVRSVVSTGGGIVCRNANWSKLQSGIVVWLNVEPELIMERIRGTDRPLLQGQDPLGTLKTLSEERAVRYAQADVKIDVTASMDTNSTVALVIKELHNFIDDNPPMWKKAKSKAQEEGLDWVQ